METTGNWETDRLPIWVLNAHRTVEILTGESSASTLLQGRETFGIVQGDTVPQRIIPELIELYQAGQFPFDRLVKFYGFSDINTAIADAKRGARSSPCSESAKGKAAEAEEGLPINEEVEVDLWLPFLGGPDGGHFWKKSPQKGKKGLKDARVGNRHVLKLSI